MENAERNPFPVYRHPTTDKFVREATFDADEIAGWKWFDETGCDCEKLYASQEAALRDCLSYVRWLNHGPTLWQRVWWPLRYKLWPLLVQFWHDQGHAARQPRVKR